MYASHGCTIASAFRYSNLEMAFGGVLSGNSALESYQYADYLNNSTNRFFVNLTNTSATNYASSSNDMDNAYLTKIKDDKVILITDESTGTYLPGTLNENVKNVTSEPTDATIATALKLSDLSGLTSAQQLAAKVAYLIYNTTLGSYGTIPIPTTTAVASLYLMDGPGSDAVWTGAKQVNEIMSWLVSGTSINIYLKSDNSINATVPTVLTPTYTLTDPSGTKTTITTSTNINGKLYFAFPKTSASGEYSVTLSYATGGTITTTVPSTAIFNYAPVPALDGTPSISGTVQYGQVLTVTPNVTSVPGITGTLSYKWKANGTIIAGATGSTYTLTANEVGKTISCDITSNAQTGTVSAIASGTVSKITLSAATVSAVNSKTYNGTTATTGGTISFSGTVNSETPTCNASIVWTSANVGTSTVNVSGISLTSLTDRYVLSVTTLSNVTPGNNATISKATPTVGIYPTAGAITYGQTLQSSTLTTSSAVVNGFSGAIAGSYAWKTSTTKPTSAGNFTSATVTFTPADATNYNSIDFDISVTVTKATLTATADAKSKVYGTANPSLTFQYSGWVNGVEAIDAAPSITTTVDGTTVVGSYSNAITLSGGSDNNYTFSLVSGDLEVTKAVLTATADNQTKVYGEANPTLTFHYSGWVNGIEAIDAAPSITTAVDGTTVVGSYSNSITLSGGSDNNYTFSFVAGTFNVTKATLTVTANNKSKIYGASEPVLDYTVTGTLFNGDASSVVTGITLSTATGAAASVGTHTITAAGGSADNYDVNLVNGTLTVSKAAALTVTANDKAKVYGASDPVLDYSATGTLYYTDTYSVISGVSLNAVTGASATSGSHTITAAGGSADNYDVTHVNGTLTVSKAAALTVTANDKAKVYGATDPDLDYTPSGILYYTDNYSVISGVSLSAPTDASATFGTHAITAAGGAADNYDVTFVNGTLTVSKAAALTITANNKSKVYGDADPVLDYTPTGTLYYADTYSVISGVSLNTATGSSAYVGTHDISPTGGSADNYDVNNVNGTLTVNKAVLTANADNKSRIYGETNPSFTITYSGFRYSDNAESLTTQPLASTTATSASDAGTYAITLTEGSDSNYQIDNTEGILSIEKAILNVSADNKSRIYGKVNPELTVSYSGFVNGDAIENIDTKPAAFTSAVLASDAGKYIITAEGGSDNNYTFEYNNGTLDITKADQILSFETIPSGLRTTQQHELVATSTSGLPVRFESSENSIADISGNNMTVLKEGTVEITAIQEGNHNWNPAAEVIQTVVMLPTFDNIRSLFTPNNDGMNDYWYIPDIEQYGTISVQIYNRFGKLLYKSSAYKNDWNGTYNGTPLPEASYYYIIKSSEKGIIKGVVNLVR
jgi:gliding motility-associated-like protein